MEWLRFSLPSFILTFLASLLWPARKPGFVPTSGLVSHKLRRLSPSGGRFVVFRVSLLDSENTLAGQDTNSLRFACRLTITKEQHQAVLDRHTQQKSLVLEDNNTMKGSCLPIDEKMRSVCLVANREQNSDNHGVLVSWIVAVMERNWVGRFWRALLDSGFDEKTFLDRKKTVQWCRSWSECVAKSRVVLVQLLVVFRDGEERINTSLENEVGPTARDALGTKDVPYRWTHLIFDRLLSTLRSFVQYRRSTTDSQQSLTGTQEEFHLSCLRGTSCTRSILSK
ncbi:hypothetical protein JVU11DRAFT_6822 [Chiua virens]|nr:hypothetical protein JVU11DRAFT_6822 [Chiua virens]